MAAAQTTTLIKLQNFLQALDNTTLNNTNDEETAAIALIANELSLPCSNLSSSEQQAWFFYCIIHYY